MNKPLFIKILDFAIVLVAIVYSVIFIIYMWESIHTWTVIHLFFLTLVVFVLGLAKVLIEKYFSGERKH